MIRVINGIRFAAMVGWSVSIGTPALVAQGDAVDIRLGVGAIAGTRTTVTACTQGFHMSCQDSILSVRHFSSIGAGARLRESDYVGRGLVVHLQVFGGTETADPERFSAGGMVSGSVSYHRTYAGAALFVGYDWTYVGYGTGAIAIHTSEDWCTLQRTGGTCRYGVTMSSGIVAFPSIQRLRLGRLSSWHVEYEHLVHEPSPLPAPILKVGLAKPFGGGRYLARAGATNVGAYIGAVIQLARTWELEPFAALDERSVDAHPRNAEVSFIVRRRISVRGR